ncbi:MAG TPA: SAM hydroxide adenosyltransferase, partial [Acidimicrobiales bacterium]
PTFAGRDVFAPVAAHLCNGVDLASLGEELDPATLRPGLLPLPRQEDGWLLAEVLWVDRFGNAQLNVGPEEVTAFGERLALRCKDQLRTGRRCGAYAELGPGEIGVLVDSYGLLALSMDQASAADQLGLRAGDEVAIGEAS